MPPSDATPPGEITRLLQQASAGDQHAFGRLVTLVYGELNALAHRRLLAEGIGHSLNTTALVHEAYLKLVDQTRAEWHNREQFFAVAAEAMRRILIDHARRRHRTKRGGHQEHVPLDEAEDTPIANLVSDDDAEALLALDEALDRLAAFNPQGARIVQLRFFGGLTNEEAATVLQSSERTVRRAWTAARAWLRRELASRSGGRVSLGAFAGDDAAG